MSLVFRWSGLWLLALPMIPSFGKTLTLPLADAPVSLDWNGLSTMIEAPIILNLNEGLFDYDPLNRTLVPAIAESVTKSPDLKEYTFKIRKDAKWSDGRPILAGDFADAWIKLLSPQSVSIYIYYLFDIENAKEFNSKELLDPARVGISVIDDHTLKIQLKHAHSNWERNTAFWPLFPIRKDQIEKFGSNWWRAGVMISSGPFVLHSYEAGKSVVLKRNPHYAKIATDIDRVEFKIGSPPEEIVKKFKSGAFDLIWGVPTDLLHKEFAETEIGNSEILRVHLLALNSTKFPMNDPEFRKGFLQAISPEDLLPGHSKQLIPQKTFIPPPMNGSTGSARLPFDIKQARAHIKKSGVLIGPKLKIRILTILIEPFYSIARNLQNQLLQNLGLEVELAAHQSKDYTAYMNLGDYAATLITWTAKVLSSQDFLLPYSREATYNRMNYSNSLFDQRIFEGLQAKESRDAGLKFLEAQRLLGVEDAVATPLFREQASTLISPSIKFIYFNHMGIPILKKATH